MKLQILYEMCSRIYFAMDDVQKRERERGERLLEREYSVTTNNYLDLMIIVAKQDGV